MDQEYVSSFFNVPSPCGQVDHGSYYKIWNKNTQQKENKKEWVCGCGEIYDSYGVLLAYKDCNEEERCESWRKLTPKQQLDILEKQNPEGANKQKAKLRKILNK